jgi:Uma2 family endonuclease
MSESAKRRASYQDVLAAPEGMIAELVDGELLVTPRPSGFHTAAHSRLQAILGPPFDLGSGGPGGWIILFEPELHLGADIVVPDLAGWRRDRLPTVENDAFFTLSPDWVCELLSPSTHALDRAEKLPVYGRSGVGHVWLIDAVQRTIEVMRNQHGRWLLLSVAHGDQRVRLEPFDAIEIDLAVLWGNAAPTPRRASEAPATYATK